MRRGRWSAAAARCVLGLVALASAAHVAEAAPRTYSVRIDSTPDGATVYLESKDSEPLGETPYRGKLKEGRHTIIVELDGYISHAQEIRVRKKKALQRFSVELAKLEPGKIEVSLDSGQPQVKGARILIDEKDVGNLPDTIAVEAGAHKVEVVREGYKTFETWVEVAEGETTVVAAQLVPDGTRTVERGGEVDEEEEPLDDEEDAAIEDEVERPAAARGVPFVALAGGVELGGRQFRYQNPTMGNLRPYDAGGVPLVRIAVDLVPLAFADSALASGWTVLASYARALPLDSSARINEGQPSETTVNVPTTWTELDVALGYRYRFGASHVGLFGGWGQHAFTFSYDEQSDILEGTIADVTYTFISVGLDARFGFGGRYAALLAGGPRLVSDTGDIATRFASTDVVAFGASGGLAATLTPTFEARLVGRFDQYGHTFTPQTGGAIAADGGTDRMFGVTLSAAFTY